MVLFFKKWRMALPIAGVVLVIFTWFLLRNPSEFDWSKPSLVKPIADYPIMEPSVLPHDPTDFIFLLVIVSSAPGGVSVERRKAIRSTWGKKDPNYERQWHVVFMTGKAGYEVTDEKLLEESRLHGDIFICDYKDTYDKILNKLLAAYYWAASKQENYKFQYVLKTDDDVYINIPRLYHWIDTIGFKRDHLYAGVLYAGEVNREIGHRHYVSKDKVPYSYYPAFCKGSMLVLSSSLLPKIVKLSTKIQRIVPDDAYVGLIMNELRIKAVTIKGMVQQSLMPYFLKFIGICTFQNVVGVGDSLTPQQIRELHSIVISTPNNVSWLWCVLRSPLTVIVMIIILLIVYFCYGTKLKLLFWRQRNIYFYPYK